MKTVDITCLCGSVQLRLSGEPAAQFYCHCDDCQATSGGAYVAVAVYPADAVSLTKGELVAAQPDRLCQVCRADAVSLTKGELVAWTLKTMPRKPCAVCGTHVLAEVPGGKQIGIKANLLPTGVFKPTFHEHCRYAVVPVADQLQHYKGYPVEFGGTDETVGW